MTETCPVCGGTHPTLGSLREHVWDTHDACHYCGSQIDERETLYVHWLAVHSDMLSNRDRQQAEQAVGPLTFGDRLAHQGLSAFINTRWPARILGGSIGAIVIVSVLVVLGLTPNVLGSGSTQTPYHATSGATGTAVGQQPQQAALQTVNESQVTLPGGQRPTVVFYMAAWCPSCRVGANRLQQIHQKYGSQVRLVSVDIDPQRDSMSDLQSFKQSYAGNWSHAMATPAFVKSYRIQRLDTMLVLNRHGVVVYHGSEPSVETLDTTLSHLTNTTTGGLQNEHYGKLGGVHWHATLNVTIEGDHVNFSKPSYMVQSAYVHFEQGNGTRIHKHARNVTLGDFFDSIGWQLTSDCLTTRNGTEYCSNSTHTLHVTVNGTVIEHPAAYRIRDGDRIRVIYS